MGRGVIYRYSGPLRGSNNKSVWMRLSNILGMTGQFLTMHKSSLMKNTHLLGSRSNRSSWVVWRGGLSNGNGWTSSIHMTFLLPESALHDAQLMLDTVFISLYVVPTDRVLLLLSPPISSMNLCHHHLLILYNDYG